MRFRRCRGDVQNSVTADLLSLNEVRKVISAAIEPAHFFVAKPLILEWQHCPSEEIPWEIHQGRLLDAAHTRLQQAFESWSIFGLESGNRTPEPILSLKLDAGSRQLHVTRAVHCYAWEGYHAGDNVYLSRETLKWVCELVGTIHLDGCEDADDLHDEIISLLFQAVVGCSRLPLQSVEAPMPAFSLGSLGYVYRSKIDAGPPCSCPMQSFRDLIEYGLQVDLAWTEKAKLLESLLRGTAAQELGATAALFMSRWHTFGHSTADFFGLCRTLFNDVSLSPYTGFVDNTLIFLGLLKSQGEISAEAYADFLGYMLRQNVRHLTAYDLITFHHRGANYPDALLLDTVLKAYLALIEDQPELFFASPEDDTHRQKAKRIRRRALRQAWLMRRACEGLMVPDAPTSPGENSRVLPPPYPRVPEEQIFQPDKRTKRLFDGDPIVFPDERCREVMQQCQSDLQHPEELQELGMAVFLDRPFGVFKSAAEPDRTLLLSYETFSPSIAEHRLHNLAQDSAFNLSAESLDSYSYNLRANLPVKGVSLTSPRKQKRPAAVALEDAARVADDFVVLRTTRQAVQDFLEQFDCTALAERISLDYLDAHQRVLIVSAAATRFGPDGIVDIYDANLQRRLELHIDPSQGYRTRAGHEYPAAGMQVRRVDPCEHVLERERITLLPRE
jgi:hypothetical protein